MPESAQFAYVIRPTRPAMLTDGPTPDEAARVDEHFHYLEDLTARGTVILAGRTLTTDVDAFGIVILRAASEDAARRGIGQGDRARVWNARGTLKIRVRLDYSLRPGCVVITNGYWNAEGANPNLLSKGRETDMGHGSAFHDNMVEVEKAD